MAKMRVYNTHFISIEQIEKMKENWFVKRGNYIAAFNSPIVAAFVSNRDGGRVFRKENLIEVLSMIANQSGVIAIPL